MNQRRKIVFLYTEIAAYTTACMSHFASRYPDVDLHLVRWPVNAEAPFQFQFPDSIRVYERKAYTQETLFQLMDDIQPDLILCSGWIDKTYVRICRKWNDRIPVVLAMDNKWLGTWRQQLARIVARFSILKAFRYAWVPGESQKKYALRLGFPASQIQTGFYAADAYFFGKQFENQRAEKRNHFPHRFIYAGRYYDFKGVHELWTAFDQLKKETQTDWELWCLGTGDVEPAQHPGIRHFGFVQPADVPDLMRQAGVFILPSRVEPWAVVVHEFAAAGFPLILSNAVGSRQAFLQENKNGFTFSAGDVGALVTAMQAMMSLSDEKLIAMSENSHHLGMQITPDTWADTLAAFLMKQTTTNS